MKTTPETIEHLLNILTPALEDVRAQKMFGEYALYYNEKVVGLVCRDELVVKLTPQGEAFASELEHRSAYPGSKPGLHVPKDRWNDADWLTQLIQITADNVPKKK